MSKRLEINLASEPFRRDRPLLAASIALSAVLGVLLITLTVLAIQARADATEARATLEGLARQTSTQQREIARLEASMRESNNAAILDRSLFLNMLIQRKAVSWTRVFSDLSLVLPPDVRLVSVRPQILGNNQVVLDLTVAAASSRPVINLLMKLESSPRFGSTAVMNWRPPSQNDNFYSYRITANYKQQI